MKYEAKFSNQHFWSHTFAHNKLTQNKDLKEQPAKRLQPRGHLVMMQPDTEVHICLPKAMMLRHASPCSTAASTPELGPSTSPEAVVVLESWCQFIIWKKCAKEPYSSIWNIWHILFLLIFWIFWCDTVFFCESISCFTSGQRSRTSLQLVAASHQRAQGCGRLVRAWHFDWIWIYCRHMQYVLYRNFQLWSRVVFCPKLLQHSWF